MCGIVGCITQEAQASYLLYPELMALQHRGKEGAGLATLISPKTYCYERGRGEMPLAFLIPSDKDLRAKLIGDLQKDDKERNGSFAGEFPPRTIGAMSGHLGIGHTRYGTTGAITNINLQPIKGHFGEYIFFLAHNGNLVNTLSLRQQCNCPADCSDTNVIALLLANAKQKNFTSALRETVEQLDGAFSLVLIFDNQLYAIRDRFGFHPLQLGQRDGNWFVASESCAFDAVGAKLVRDINPGEIVVINENGPRDSAIWSEAKLKIDIFEYIYFLRPDSVVHGVEAGTTRRHMGYHLAYEHPLDVDVILPIPDSGNEAAWGYWQGLAEQGQKVIFDPWALFRPHTVSRTFIEPIAEWRERMINMKLNPRHQHLKGKRVVIVDDSIVRAKTLSVVTNILRQAGVKEINMVVSSPPYRYPDFYGIDTYRLKGELIASKYSGSDKEVAAQIADKYNIKYLGYLSLDKTIQAVVDSGEQLKSDNFYLGPFTGEYPAGKGDFI